LILTKIILTICFISGIIILSSCITNTPNSTPIPEVTSTYLVLGHIYQWGTTPESNRIDLRLERVDFTKYDGILLGGDLCTETTKFESTVDYLDSIFDLGSERTLWSLGNHDARNGHSDWITARTQRPLFYTTYFDDVQWLVLNTSFDSDPDNDSYCADMAEQWRLITTLLDTVQHASNLVILAHFALWGNVERDGMRTWLYANAEKGWVNLVCDSIKLFDTDVYPRLLKVVDRRVHVTVISGDGGQLSKQYSYTSKEGIDFFITGINNSIDTLMFPSGTRFNFNPDSVLELKLHHATGILEHKFITLVNITD